MAAGRPNQRRQIIDRNRRSYRRPNIEYLTAHLLRLIWKIIKRHPHQRVDAAIDRSKSSLLLAIAKNDQLASLESEVDEDAGDTSEGVVIRLPWPNDVTWDCNDIFNVVR